MILTFWIVAIFSSRLSFRLLFYFLKHTRHHRRINMGTCVGKEKTSASDSNAIDTSDGDIFITSPQQPEPHQTIEISPHSLQIQTIHEHHSYKRATPAYIDALVLETLSLIPTLVDNDREPPKAILTLHNIAEHEHGWLAVVWSLVKVIPLTGPFGPAVIILLLDDCPLPTKESVSKLSQMFKLSRQTSISGRRNTRCHRNIGIVLGCLAEKLAGPISIHLLTNDVLEYLIANLNVLCHEHVILHSMIALEKFAQTSENKLTLVKRFSETNSQLLELFETWCNDANYSKREVGFCARWCLDNLFVMEDRPYSYEKIDCETLNVKLNDNDASEYLKLSPDGTEARCDASSFESVRCTFQVDKGIWYYEVKVITNGVMQLGWATKNSKFLNYDGYGIGDDEYSIAYDGCRQVVWHNAHSEPHSHPCWKPGDILGSLLNLNNEEITFYLNGDPLPPVKSVFQYAKSGFFSAASFMSFQQCQFNFGQLPFKFPPTNIAFKCFNDYGQLSDEERLILPKHKKLAMLRSVSVKEDSCTLCFDNTASVILQPCQHLGFCMDCAIQLDKCPLCRDAIQSRDIVS
ncbi:RING finger and SPRY domain-containing protein 1-like [Tubulanus polymorphus]|uniref:RING finger and SPRY domain-containing protein 1-like n=1 Tax=Tubulanus polymorphus TaxID=672921 RepID=UPI003DA58924